VAVVGEVEAEAEAEERAGRVQEAAYAHDLQEVVGDDSSTSDHMAVAAAAGRGRSAVDNADRQGVSMDVAVVAAGADWSATAHAP